MPTPKNVVRVELGDRGYLDVPLEQLLNKVASDVALRIESEMGDRVREVIRGEREKAIAARLPELLDEVFAEPIRRTDSWGQPVGPETTMREEIKRVVIRELRRSPDANRPTLLDQVIGEQVNKALRSELTEQLTQARQEVVRVLNEEASQVLAETLERATRRVL